MSSLKSSHHSHVKLVQIPDTHNASFLWQLASTALLSRMLLMSQTQQASFKVPDKPKKVKTFCQTRKKFQGKMMSSQLNGLS